MKETSFTLEIPFAEARISYSPRAFSGPMHYLSARSAWTEEIAAPRNLARNGYDCHGNTSCCSSGNTAVVKTQCNHAQRRIF